MRTRLADIDIKWTWKSYLREAASPDREKKPSHPFSPSHSPPPSPPLPQPLQIPAAAISTGGPLRFPLVKMKKKQLQSGAVFTSQDFIQSTIANHPRPISKKFKPAEFQNRIANHPWPISKLLSSSDPHQMTFYLIYIYIFDILTFFLTFYLTYILTFYLASRLAFYLESFWHSIWCSI